MRVRPGTAVLCVALVVGLASCGGGGNDPLATGSSSSSGSGGRGFVIGSADFSESVLLAELYAGAVQKKGVEASVKHRIGAREIYLKALEDGSIQAIPEYTGALALYYKKDFAETEPKKVLDGLTGLLPQNLQLLTPSAAEDKDSLTVTRETAEKYQLKKVSDLVGKADEMVLGGPDEIKNRPHSPEGLKRVYGITFKQLRTPLAGQAAVTALKNGQIQAANIFTTDPSIRANDFVVLEDDKRIFGTQNVVPLLVKKSVTPQITEALNGVSAKLTTSELQELMSKVDLEKQDPKKVAQEWLGKHGLG